MFEYKVPLFVPGPLKKEILLALRDLTWSEQVIRYLDYTDGIVSGCEFYEDNMRIGIRGGIVKFGGRIFLLKEPVSVPYEPTDAWTILKIRFSPQVPDRNYEFFTGQLVLDQNTQVLPNELEMGRFKLKAGSRLRSDYKDFADMQTEYDTVNLACVKQAERKQTTLAPAITVQFAREAYACIKDNALDAAFCGDCLKGDALPREYIQQYVAARLNRPYAEMEQLQLYEALEQVLHMIQGNAARSRRPVSAGIRLMD